MGGRARAEPLAAETQAKITQEVRRVGGSRFWGAALVVRDGEEAYFRGFGEAAPDMGAVSADSLFDIGSVSKQFTAAGILRLVDQRKVSLDATAASYFEGLEVAGPGRDITVRQLLQHTSGLSDSIAIQPLNFEKRDEAVRRALSSKLADTPGAQFAYSNAGYVVLAALIEHASGEAFETFLHREVFEPAGLRRPDAFGAGFLDGEGVDRSRQTQRVTAMESGREGLILDKTVEPWAWGLRGAGGVVMSPRMFVSWDKALNDDRVLPEALRRLMFERGRGGYGFGWFVETTSRNTRRFTHSGRTRGYSASFTRLVDDHIAIVVLSDESTNAPAIGTAIENVLFPPPPMDCSATIYPAGLDFNEHGMATISRQIACEVSRANDVAQRVILSIRQGTSIVAEVRFAAGAAAKAGADLKDAADDNSAGAKIDRPSAVVIALQPYRNAQNPEAAIELPSGLISMVQPRYVGQNEDGSTVIDPRAILVLVDEQRRFWPIILRLGNAEAERVGQELRDAAK